ncbi:hypothetical protein DGG96_08920 [Legionella qingyii]|uniref:Uncharacterized protein n=1 Tax=Legionella qingyii TaxID=2184757 RepID=A0A317U6C7_9GAMM|nr:hypothetical protein [Legionella qingyii]PWY56052.1 hypothetical protein DGG96_08920 [Legionella qingyii]RUR22054.1 hypothetical protein ELY20_10840 [Legionella qingyii]RUR25634.1 hypothetical protein ELY16_09650 [Legionella qingyii]
MAKKNKQQEDDTNYSFLLKCMAAFSAAAIATAGVIAAVSLKSAAVATTALAAKTLLASAFIFTPVLPIALFAIGLMLVVPFLFGCNNNTYTTVRTTTPGYRSYGSYSFYTPSSVYNGFPYSDYGTGTVYASTAHSHGHPTSGTVHGHSSSHVHGHGDSHVHGHGGSHVHGHF